MQYVDRERERNISMGNGVREREYFRKMRGKVRDHSRKYSVSDRDHINWSYKGGLMA